MHVADLNWKKREIGLAMGLPEDYVAQCLTDGRSAVFFVTRRLAVALPNYNVVPSAQVKHALTDQNGDIWAVKCITKNGVDFSKSKMRGVGRTFNQAEFDRMLAGLAGFFVADIVDFPRVPVWQIEKRIIGDQLRMKNSSGAALSRNEVMRLVTHQ